MNVFRVVGLGLLGLTVALGVRAQNLSRAPSAEEACLTPGPAERGMPEYPKEMLERRDGADAEVTFVFSGPDVAPQVKPVGKTRRDDFFEAIRVYAQKFRVPCMAIGAPEVSIAFRFNFVPNDGRKVSYFIEDSPEGAERHQALRRCLQYPPKDRILYPKRLLRSEQQGVVIAGLQFDSPDAAPRVKFLHDGGHPSFVNALDNFIRDIRLPCLNEGERFETRIDWKFKIEGGDRAWIKDLPLMDFLGAVKGIEREKVFFDFNTMGCPFVASFQLRQPYADNVVGTVGDFDLSRLQFVRWLERLDLKIPERHRELIMANAAQIQIPCGRLDL